MEKGGGSGGKQACPLPVDRDRLGLEVSTVNRPENCSLTEGGGGGGGGSRRAPEAPRNLAQVHAQIIGKTCRLWPMYGFVHAIFRSIYF